VMRRGGQDVFIIAPDMRVFVEAKKRPTLTV
jgi:hypothetical protein